MCVYLTNGNFLGQRLIGYDCYESKSKGFIGMSEKQIIDKLKKGERVYGFVLGREEDKDALVLDADGFNMTNDGGKYRRAETAAGIFSPTFGRKRCFSVWLFRGRYTKGDATASIGNCAIRDIRV